MRIYFMGVEGFPVWTDTIMPHNYAVIENLSNKEKKSIWDYATGVSDLVRHNPSGRYYARFQVAGKRRMKALNLGRGNGLYWPFRVCRIRSANTCTFGSISRVLWVPGTWITSTRDRVQAAQPQVSSAPDFASGLD